MANYNDLTQKERALLREDYRKKQKNLCMFCKKSLDSEPPEEILQKKINWKFFPENFLKYPIHLQHCHKTGETKGAVHAYCNAVMWQYHKR